MRPLHAVAAVALLLMAGPASAQEVRGTFALEQDLIVPEGETFRIAPGTLVTGPGRLLVRGVLLAEGTPREPVRIAAPVVLEGPDRSRLDAVRFLGVPGVALVVRGSAAVLSDAVFEENGAGLRLEDADVELVGVRFLRNRGAAVEATGATRLHVEDALFRENARAALLRPSDGADLTIANATFVANARDVEVAVDADTSGRVLLLANVFGMAAHGLDSENPQAASVHVHGPLDAEPGGDAVVLSRGNRYQGGVLGLAATGGGYVARSEGDTIAGVAVAVRAEGAAVRSTGGVLAARTWDVVLDGRADVDLGDSAYDPARVLLLDADPPPPAASTGFDALRAGAVVGVLAAAAVGILLTRPGRAAFLRAASALRASGAAAARDREALRRYVREHPGADAARAARDLRLAEARLAARVEELEREGEIVVDRAFSPPRLSTPAGGPPLRRMERLVYDEIRERPGRAQAEIAAALGLSRQALHYHVKKLEQAGLVVKVTRGRETLCYAGSEAAPSRADEAAARPKET